MKLFNHKYNQAQLWIATLQAREDKKPVVPVPKEGTEEKFKTQFAYTTNNNTVFTKADTGHNKEEASKIQQVYNELKSLPVGSSLALH